jgi:hypothetical protein
MLTQCDSFSSATDNLGAVPGVLAVIPMARKTSANSINELAIERSEARVPDIAS